MHWRAVKLAGGAGKPPGYGDTERVYSKELNVSLP